MFDEIIAPLFTTEWGRRTGIGIAILMACLLLYTSVSMLFTWRADYRMLHAKPASAASHVAGAENIAQLISQIPNAHLFGHYGAVSGTAGLPVTSLQLHLIGVIKAVPEKFSRVIISEGNQPGKVYQVGDTLSSGVKVYAITDEGVVLENGGTLENLPLQRSGLEFQGKPKSMLNKKEESPEE